MFQVKSYHVPAEQIERQLGEIEANLARLEKEGVELEKKLRSCEEGADFWSLPRFLCLLGPANERQSSGPSDKKVRVVPFSGNDLDARFDALFVPRVKFPGRLLLLLPCEQEAWLLCSTSLSSKIYVLDSEMSLNLLKIFVF